MCLASLFFTKAYPRVLLRLHSGMYRSTIPPSVILAGHHGSIFRFEEAVHSHPDTYPSFSRVSGIRNRATVLPAFGLKVRREYLNPFACKGSGEQLRSVTVHNVQCQEAVPGVYLYSCVSWAGS